MRRTMAWQPAPWSLRATGLGHLCVQTCSFIWIKTILGCKDCKLCMLVAKMQSFMLPKKRCAVPKAAAKESHKHANAWCQRQLQRNCIITGAKQRQQQWLTMQMSSNTLLEELVPLSTCPQGWLKRLASTFVDVVSGGHLSVCHLTGIRQQLAQHGVVAKNDFFTILVLVELGIQCVGCCM